MFGYAIETRAKSVRLKRSRLQAAVCTAAVAAALFAAPANAQSGQKRYPINIGAVPLAEGLRYIQRETGVRIAFSPDQVAERSSYGVAGNLTPEEALKRLLEGTGLVLKSDGEQLFVVVAMQSSADAPSQLLSKTAAVGSDVPMPSAEPAPSAPALVDEIVVTGTRVVRDGYEAPTPVSVVTAENLQEVNPNSLTSALIQLPQLGKSFTTATGSKIRPGDPVNMGNFLNLRDLGTVRTMLLIDGRRVPPTTYNGNVNTDVVPDLLVERVDVVTGGASAVYGSDAVAGVVNYVLDHDFTGTKGVVQGGISEFGDYTNYRAGLATGFALGERTHVLLSAEYYHNDGFLLGDRPKLDQKCAAVGSVRGTAAAGTAANPIIFDCNMRADYTSSIDGLHPLTGPLTDIFFTEPGVYRTFNPGTPSGSANLFYGPSDHGYVDNTGGSIAGDIDRYTGFAQVTHELNDDVRIFANLSALSLENRNLTFSSYTSTLLTIYSGNPYLPAALQQRLTAAGTTSFTARHQFGELPIPEAIDEQEVINFAVGFEGEFRGFDWELNYQRSHSLYKMNLVDIIENTRMAAALDAVIDPATGNIVCNPQLSASAAVRERYKDCAPFNPFGKGAYSVAASNYVTENPSSYKATNSSNSIDFAVAGDVFELPAGPVTAAIGGEWRDLSLNLTSNSDPSVPLDATGLRANAPVATGVRFFFTNTAPAAGDQSVIEGFGEVLAPIFADKPFAKSLDITGAVRLTDYKTSGFVKTWKVGSTWAPIDDIRLRATRSRDIRAPVLYDLYLGQSINFAAVNDPHTGLQSAVPLVTGGNRDLRPEIADTWALGVVLQPSFLPEISLSVDYYNIKIRDAISTPAARSILENCEASNGTGPICSFVDRPLAFSDRSPANFPTQVRAIRQNLAGLWQEGIDFNASYSPNVAVGTLRANLYASYLISNLSQNSPLDPVSDNTNVLRPTFNALASINYRIGQFGINVAEQIIGPIERYSNVQVYATPPTPWEFYTNLTLTYDLQDFGADAEAFFNATNVFGAKAPIISSFSGFAVTDTSIYHQSVVGRTFSVGVRFNF